MQSSRSLRPVKWADDTSGLFIDRSTVAFVCSAEGSSHHGWLLRSQAETGYSIERRLSLLLFVLLLFPTKVHLQCSTSLPANVKGSRWPLWYFFCDFFWIFFPFKQQLGAASPSVTVAAKLLLYQADRCLDGFNCLWMKKINKTCLFVENLNARS